jgi:predicted TIM-barrel fold metal-dependent hydrolase
MLMISQEADSPLIDSHLHIFPGEFKRERENLCARDSGFAALYGNPKSRMVTACEAIEVMNESGVQAAVALGFPWKDPCLSEEHNDYIWEASRDFEGRFIPLGCVNPSLGKKALAESRRCLEKGFKGIGELASYGKRGSMSVLFFREIPELLAHFRVPILLHVTESVGHDYPGKSSTDLGELYRWISLHREIVVILAHWGGGMLFYELMPEVREAFQRVFYDTAASPFLYSPKIYRAAVNIVGAEKILWGSDYPLIHPRRYFREMEQAGLSKEDREAIMSSNAARIWGVNRGPNSLAKGHGTI